VDRRRSITSTKTVPAGRTYSRPAFERPAIRSGFAQPAIRRRLPRASDLATLVPPAVLRCCNRQGILLEHGNIGDAANFWWSHFIREVEHALESSEFAVDARVARPLLAPVHCVIEESGSAKNVAAPYTGTTTYGVTKRKLIFI